MMTESAVGMGPWPKWTSYLLRLAVGCTFLAVLARRVDVPQVVEQLRGVAPGPILAALGIYGLMLFVHTWRWRLVLASRTVLLPLSTCLRLLLAAGFLNLFLPGNLGGDVYRVLGARRVSASLLQSAGIVVLERYCGFLATFLLALGGLAVTDFVVRQPAIAALVLLLFALFLLPTLWAANPALTGLLESALLALGLSRLAAFVTRIVRAMRDFLKSPRLIAQVVVLSIVMKLCVVVVFRLLGAALDLEIAWDKLLVFLPIHTVVSALPISLNGLGVREANLVGFFTMTGLTEAQSASLALLHLIWLYGTGIPGGLLLLGRRRA